MCGCAVELNMKSFIRARQKDTPNTDEAQALIHTDLYTQTHTPVSVSSSSPFTLSKTLSKTFPGEYFQSQGTSVCAHQLLLSLVRRQG